MIPIEDLTDVTLAIGDTDKDDEDGEDGEDDEDDDYCKWLLRILSWLWRTKAKRSSCEAIIM